MAKFESVKEVDMFYDMVMANQLTGQGPKGTCVEYATTSTMVSKTKYPQTSRTINGRKIYMRIHRLALLKKMRVAHLDSSIEASHLCHNTKCMNMDHIVAETHESNQSRITCANERKNMGNSNYCTGDHYGNPNCI